MKDSTANIDYEAQFNITYNMRLLQLKDHIKEHANKLNGYKVLDSIDDVEKLKKSDKNVIIGTLFIVSDLKSNIFDKIQRKPKHKKPIDSKTYYSKDIKYFLEDSTGRIEVNFSNISKIHEKNFLLSTGMCLGLIGGYLNNGIFLADDIVMPYGDYSNMNTTSEKSKSSSRICFISSPKISKSNSNNEKLIVILDYLKDKSINEYVIMGNFFAEEEEITEFDKMLSFAKAKITLIPDFNDFGAKVIPLAPPHPKFFNTNVSTQSCPFSGKIAESNITILPMFIIRDLLKYLPQDIKNIQSEQSEYKMHVNEKKFEKCHTQDLTEDNNNVIHAMKLLIRSGHMCPTAPDTILSVPFNKKDPFLIEKGISYFCVGGAKMFAQEKIPGTESLLFTIPKFSDTSEVLILNSDSGEIEILKFDMEDF